MIDPMLLIIASGLAAVLAVLFADWLWRHLNREDPRAVLRRCHFNLWCVRRDLDSLPADREVCDAYAEVERLNQALIRKTGAAR